jgi:hypothetical protein
MDPNGGALADGNQSANVFGKVLLILNNFCIVSVYHGYKILFIIGCVTSL